MKMEYIDTRMAQSPPMSAWFLIPSSSWNRFVFELIRDMLAMLIDEETDAEGMGPCMEFMLGQNILRTAVSLAQGDFPKGIRAEILKFFTKLLTDISQVMVFIGIESYVVHCIIRM